jgi:predicted dehydrogenase
VRATTDPLRVGIIGTGWGALVHTPAFRLVDGYDVVAVCARNEERLALTADKLGITDTSTDWEAFVGRDDIDVVSVATPVELHHPITLAALAAGKHVLCEKPLALTAEQAREMVVAAEASDRATATCFELRWTAERLPIWDLVRDGFVGDPYFSRLTQSASYWHPTHKPQAPWMYDVAKGGGYLAGMLSHDIDWICTMFGEPVAVCADVRTSIPAVALPDGHEIAVTADDTTTLILRLASGAGAEVSASVVGAHTAGWRFEAFGADGTIVATGGRGERSMAVGRAADDGLSAWTEEPRLPRSRPDLPQRGATSAILAIALMLEDWLPAFRGKPAPVPTFRDGWRVQAVIEAARSSSGGAGWVALEGDGT